MLIDAGVPAEQLDFLPNPVWFQPTETQPFDLKLLDAKRLFVYPTRAIRRKNIGEFLFWAAVAPRGDRFATTLAPQNPEALKRYQSWVQFAKSEQLPVTFEATTNLGVGYNELLSASDGILSTSVAEGFGLAFLEPWLIGKPLFGRDLPEITGDFKDVGVRLDSLYTDLKIPIHLIGRQVFEEKVAAGLESYLGSYGLPYRAELKDRAMDHLLQDEMVDFGMLDEELQKRVITQIKASRDSSYALCQNKPSSTVFKQNRYRTEKNFNLTKYGQRLNRVYESMLDSSAQPAAGSTIEFMDGDKVLKVFVSSERFCLIRN